MHYIKDPVQQFFTIVKKVQKILDAETENPNLQLFFANTLTILHLFQLKFEKSRFQFKTLQNFNLINVFT